VQGDVDARNCLAVMSWDGDGVARDKAMALALLNLAAERGSDCAENNRLYHMARMTAEEILEARTLTEEWRRKIEAGE
jgi:TPR repeat protein